jgi:cell wall-associated NlpC family hydrolase
MTVEEILSAARECLGTPFVHQGRIVGIALDCAGVIVHTCERLGITVEQPTAYARLPHDAMLESWIDKQDLIWPVAIPQAGDILLMKFTGDPQHLAIFTGENVIHAYEEIGRTVEHRLDAKWRKRIVRAYRFIGLES